ncbi:hypothetical protein FDUTEX481_00504 [Tolypothrix sp. PCC 7601]|nr:hypothetical protein FDUTEX481_00504 [Tolypothrix sp. PCC 7601]
MYLIFPRKLHIALVSSYKWKFSDNLFFIYKLQNYKFLLYKS